MNDTQQTVDITTFSQLRGELGANFVRILGYFREDGEKTIAAIEEAMRDESAVALVRPAHTLKGESLQFGAERLGFTAERIEKAARQAVEGHYFPDEVIGDAAMLRSLFADVMGVFDRETVQVSPVRKAMGFGRKVGFGRA